MRPRGVKQLTQSHTAIKWQSWDPSPGSLPPETRAFHFNEALETGRGKELEEGRQYLTKQWERESSQAVLAKLLPAQRAWLRG